MPISTSQALTDYCTVVITGAFAQFLSSAIRLYDFDVRREFL